MNILLPYAERRNSSIVAKIGGHGGGKLQSREVEGRFVTGVKRITASNR
jgi:hypothetical protein